MTDWTADVMRVLRRVERKLRGPADWSASDRRLHAEINRLIFEGEQLPEVGAPTVPVQVQEPLKVQKLPPKTDRRHDPAYRALMLPVWQANAAKAREARMALTADRKAREAAEAAEAAKPKPLMIIRTIVKEVPVPQFTWAPPPAPVDASTTEQPTIEPKHMGKLFWAGQGRLVSNREKQRIRMSGSQGNGTMADALHKAADSKLREGLAALQPKRFWVECGVGEDDRPCASIIARNDRPEPRPTFTLHGPFGSPGEADTKRRDLMHQAMRYT